MCIYLVGPKEVSPEGNQLPWEELSLGVGNTLWERRIGGGVGGMFPLLCAWPTLVPVSGYRIARSTSISREGLFFVTGRQGMCAGKGLRLVPDSAVSLTHSWCHVSFPYPGSPTAPNQGGVHTLVGSERHQEMLDPPPGGSAPAESTWAQGTEALPRGVVWMKPLKQSPVSVPYL